MTTTERTEDGRPEWGYCATWRADIRMGFLSNNARYVVNLNNHTDVSEHPTWAEAQLQAARLNYANGSYYRPAMFGLDGIE